MKTHRIKLLLAICAAGGISAASAQTTNIIFGTDFEGNGNYTTSYGYAYAGGNIAGNAASGFTGGVTAGVGVTNSSAWDSMPDFTATGSDPNYTNSSQYTYSGTEAPLSFTGTITPMTPTANVDSYTISFDAKVEGLLPGVNTTTVYFNALNIQTNGVTWIGLTGGAFTVGSNFVHFDIPLSQLTLAVGTFNDLTNSDILNTVSGFVADFRVTDERGTLQVNRSPVWGFDNDNQLIIDNVFLSQSSATVPPPTYERLIWEINFDDKSTTDRYGFVFRDGQNFATTAAAINPTDGIGGSAGFQVTSDITPWSTNPPTSFSGFGGGAGLANPYTLSNTNKSGYRVYWNAKVGGLLDGVETANGNLSFQFLVPPGTLTPSNSGEALILELAPNFILTSNYTSFVFDGATMPIGLYNGGSQAMFNQYISKVNLVQVQAQFNPPSGQQDIGTVFGYDADNTMTVDNIKVVELAQGIAPLSIVNSNGVLRVYWSDPLNVGTAKLQSATNVAGPYIDVPGATSAATSSPYTVPAGPHYFRAKWVSP